MKKSLSDMWPEFLKWADEYVGCGLNGSAIAMYSREDMRYAYQAGYEKSEWISVDDELPEITESVLITNNEITGHAYYMGEHWKIVASNTPVNKRDVTHWMPLPEPPK